MGGRITIIEAVLNSQLIHILAALPTPVTVINRLSGIMASFLWGQNDNGRRHWIKWTDVCSSKQEGGLGISHLDTIRVALQNKLAWRCMGASSLWGRYMRSRYRVGETGSHIWTALSKLLPSLCMQAEWKIGQGSIGTNDFCWIFNIKPPPQMRMKSIREVWEDHGNRAALLELLPEAGKLAFQQMVFSQDLDELQWMRSSDGLLTAKAVKRRLTSPQGEVARTVWAAGHRLFGIQRPNNLKQLWQYWFQDGNVSTYMEGLRLLWACCGIWEIWKYRNNAIHGSGRYEHMRHLYNWVHSLARLINLPFIPNLPTNLTLSLLHIPRPYTPRSKWKWWCPHPHGNTLNAAWRPHGNGLRAAYILRDATGSVKWHLVSSAHDPLNSLLDALLLLRDLNMMPQAIQTCHPMVNNIKLSRPRSQVALRVLSLVKDISMHRICNAANSAASSLICSDPLSPDDAFSRATRLALRGDRLRLPSLCSSCHACLAS
ncbi:hypothetical protein QQ045_024688 [Rhodiola kirilowii]